MKLEKRKRPRVFEEWVLLTSPKSSVVVCLRAQQQQQRKENKKKKKSVWCLSSQSVFIVLVLIFVPLCSNRSRVHPHLISVSLFKKKKEKKKKGGEGREKEEESSAVFTVWYVGGIWLPRPVQPHLPSCWIEIQREGKADQEIGIFAVGEEVVGSAGLLCSAVRGQEDPPPSPLLFRTLMGGDRAQHKEKMKMKTWAVTTAIV